LPARRASEDDGAEVTEEFELKEGDFHICRLL
jgi:hypothetical protein